METKNNKRLLATLAKKYGTLLAFVVICAYFSIATDVFLTPSNILTVLRQISMLSILGAGLTVVMITGRIDLSIGFGASILGVMAAALMVDFGMPIWLAAVLTLLAACSSVCSTASSWPMWAFPTLSVLWPPAI